MNSIKDYYFLIKTEDISICIFPSQDLPCVEKWFWPETKTEDDEEEEEDDKDEEEEEKDEEEEEELEVCCQGRGGGGL